MGDPVDVELMALADGALGRAEAEALQARVAANPEFAERLVAFEATRHDALRVPFIPILNAPVPDKLIAAVMGATGASGAPSANELPRRSADVLQFRRPEAKRKGWTFDAKTWGLGTVAAAMLGVIGIAAWQQRTTPAVSPKVAPEVAAVSEQGPDMARLGPLLERLASSAIGSLADGSWSVKPVNTLPAQDGRWCREVNLKGDGSFWAGLACRSKAGAWQMQALVEWKGAKPAFDTGSVRPSGLEPPQEIAAAAANAGAGNPINGVQERELIARGWK